MRKATIPHGNYPDLPPDQLKNIYLDRYAYPGIQIANKPKTGTKIIVAIPCFNEAKVLDSLQSLFNCEDPGCIVEVIVVVNHGSHEDAQIKNWNIEISFAIEKWAKSHEKSYLSFHLIRAFDLPNKHAGVGLARKIGMDEAVKRLEEIDEKNGVIACFDSDCLCSPNFLKEIATLYKKKPATNAALLYFEHPLRGDFQSEVYDGIVNYELHLRYYKNALKFTGFPFAYHTVGSCITVSSEAYQKQGGMNKKKAGEDFYFLQKIFPLGGIENITSAIIYPSPRPSNRVPFGTGRAINQMLAKPNNSYETYNPKSFIDLKPLIDLAPEFYHKKAFKSMENRLPPSISEFLKSIDFSSNISKIRKNHTSEKRFLNSFFQWFNGFTVLKFVHFARDYFHENIDVFEASKWIISKLMADKENAISKRTALQYLRELDRSD